MTHNGINSLNKHELFNQLTVIKVHLTLLILKKKQR